MWKQRLPAATVGATTVGATNARVATAGDATVGTATIGTATTSIAMKLKCYKCGSNTHYLYMFFSNAATVEATKSATTQV